MDGKHHALAKTIVEAAAFAFDGKSRALSLFFRDAGCEQHVEQIAPARGRETEAKGLGDFAAQAALFKVIDRYIPLTALA